MRSRSQHGHIADSGNYTATPRIGQTNSMPEIEGASTTNIIDKVLQVYRSAYEAGKKD